MRFHFIRLVYILSDYSDTENSDSSEVPLSPQQRQKIEAIRDLIVDLVAEALEGKVPHPELKAAIVVDTADALTHRWIVDDAGQPLDQNTMASELKQMLNSYLANPR